jgi:hypothetical protein
MGKKPNIKKETVLIKYLKEELSECELICKNAKRQIEESIRQAHFDLNVHDKSLDSQRDNNTNDDSCEDSDTIASKKNHPKWAKKAFRDIARMTHPDKVPENLNDSMKKKLTDSYQDAKKSIDSFDYVELLLIAGDLGVDIESPESSFFDILEKKKNELTSKIRAIKSSMYWSWAHTTDEKKEEILKDLIRQRGWDKMENQRAKSRKGPGKHPGKSLAQMKKMKILKTDKK